MRVSALAAALGLQAGIGFAADRPKTIKDLESRPVEVRTDAKVDSSASRAMESYRRFLDLQKTDPQLRAEALRRLADLNLEAGELERMEKEVSQVDLGGAEAIKLYTTLLQAHPDYPRNDQVLYQLARAYETTGQTDQALATLNGIVKQHPRSPQLDEVHFRRGEILFSAKRYPEAEDAYAYVIRTGARSSFYEQSLYKHGWSLFKQSLNEDSLPSFAGVLDAKLVDPAAPGGVSRIEKMPRADRELVEDTLRVMSITFSYLDGAATVDQFVGGRRAMPYAHLLYSRLGDLYVDKQRYQDAAATYRAFVGRDPNNEYAPGLSMQAIEAYKKGGFGQLVLDGKREYVERYNFSSPFWQGRERASYPSVVQELKVNLKDVAQYFHANAQKSKNLNDYQQAARWYRDYLNSFPDDPDSAGTNMLLAETLFESKQYADAATEYERTAYAYPINAKSAAAGYAAIVAYDKEKERLTGEARGAWHKRSIDSGVKFAQTFPEHPDSAGVLTRAAQDIFQLADLPRAIQVSEMILARQPPVDAAKQRIAWTIIGQSHFDLGAFDKAEPAYVQARALVPAGDPLQTDLTERIASSVYKQGEAKQKAGDAAGAVEDFLRVSRVAPGSKIRATAEYDAAAQLINLKDWNRAITVLENYRRDFPKSEFQADVTRKLAVAYNEAGQSGSAALEFERIAASATEDRAVRREATLQAADLFEKAGNATKTVAMLEQFVASYPTPVAEAIEARQRLADLADKAGNVERQLHWFREIVQSDRGAGAARTDRTRYLAAKAQLALAAPARDAFRAVRLVAPLKTSLAAKRKSLESALNAYKSAVDYQIAEVTTAATYEMAELYRQLGADVLKSERPKKLSPEEAEQYDLLLEEQAFPFEEQAIAMHEVNAARVRERIYEEGVKRSFAALAQLKPGRYAKSELLQDVDPLLAAPVIEAPPASGTGSEAGGGVPAAAIAQPVRPSARAQADFERALGLMRAGNATEAELELKQLATAHPDLPGPQTNLAILYRKSDRLEEAEKLLRAVVAAHPAHASAWTELGGVLSRQGKFGDASAAYEEAIIVQPDYAPAHRNAGVVNDLYLDRAERALVAFERYKSLTGDDKQLNGWIAELRQRLGRPAPPAEAAPAGAPAADSAADPAKGASS
jgi:tetratricopeptide (TPR) repeat protein